MRIQWRQVSFSLLIPLFLTITTMPVSASLEGRIGFLAQSGNFREFGNWDIYVMDPDGRNVEVVMRTPINDNYPTWSPDGRLIVVQDDIDSFLHLLYPAENQLKKLAVRVGHSSMTWSPDSRYLVFHGPDHGDDTPLQILDIQTEAVFDLENSEGFWFPSWSPDGKFLVFSREGGLYVGQITADFELIEIRKLTEGSHNDPSWSPDGK